MKTTLPKSATHEWINYTGTAFAAIIAGFGIVNKFRSFDLAILMIVSYLVPIIILEVFFYKTPFNPTTGLVKSKWNFDIKRVLIKLLGLYITYIIIAFAYWLFPEYYKQTYKNYWLLIDLIYIPAIMLSIPYFIYMDAKSNTPID